MKTPFVFKRRAELNNFSISDSLSVLSLIICCENFISTCRYLPVELKYNKLILICQYQYFGIKKMNINELVAKRISELKQKERLTVEKLAWQGGLSKSCVTYALKGKYDIKISTIAGICASLKISPAEFFSTFTEIPEVEED